VPITETETVYKYASARPKLTYMLYKVLQYIAIANRHA